TGRREVREVADVARGEVREQRQQDLARLGVQAHEGHVLVGRGRQRRHGDQDDEAQGDKAGRHGAAHGRLLRGGGVSGFSRPVRWMVAIRGPGRKAGPRGRGLDSPPGLT
ncbi:hypothetical protein RZS08_05420, partial [Arthrospira platensis SPKY1]|nr:hypothetical protein [Arthrospira platensis SPKY1]